MCLIPLRTSLLTNSLTGGVWTYNGYNQTSDQGPFNETPGSIPEEFSTTLTGDNPTVESEDHSTGFYSLTYTFTDSQTGCSASVDVILPIFEGSDNGADANQTTCTSSDSVYNLFEMISGGDGLGSPVTNTNVDTNGSWSFSPTGSFFSSPTTQTAVFDMSLVTSAGTYTATYTLPSTTGNSSYTTALSGCDNCDGSSVAVTFTVNAAGNAGTPSNVYVCN